MPDLISADHVRHFSEHEFQKEVLKLAKANGWMRMHVYRGRTAQGAWRTNTSSPGWPDLTLMRPPYLVILELKRVGEKATPEQRRWIAGLQRCGIRAYIVDPTHWYKIHALLTRPGDFPTPGSSPDPDRDKVTAVTSPPEGTP